MAGGTARTRAGQPFPVLAKDYTTEDAPLSAVFGGRGFRPLKPYDVVAAFDVAVSTGDSITADSAKAVQSSTSHNSCSRLPRPSNPAKTGAASVSWRRQERGRVGQPPTTEAAPLSAVFGGRGPRPPTPCDFSPCPGDPAWQTRYAPELPPRDHPTENR